MPIPLIIDTDPGIDDALAIALACASPEVELIGVTSVGGNTGLAQTTENSLRLLHLFGRDDVPVAAGAGTPLVRPALASAEAVHGADGLGGVVLDPAPRTVDPRPAVELLRDLIEASHQPVTIAPIGPLTNIALLAAMYPASYAKIARLALMGGGGNGLGNVTPSAEFNIWYDPEAAARVFAAGVPITMVGLDVTHKAVLRRSDWEPLRGTGRVAEALLEMTDFYARWHGVTYGTEDTAQHDALAIAAVVAPSLLTLADKFVDVETVGTLTRGMTVVDMDGLLGQAPNTQVALDVDVVGFTTFFVDRLVALDDHLSKGS